MRAGQWALVLLPLVLLSVLAYAAKFIDRGRLKEINHRLLLGRWIHPRDLKPLVDIPRMTEIARRAKAGQTVFAKYLGLTNKYLPATSAKKKV